MDDPVDSGDPVTVALFPIPGLVVFPGTSVPLHVFEPRYRTMVKHCVQDKRDLALCHTLKEIHPARKHQDRKEALMSNQATYLPCRVFSAGPCEILKTTSDGRLHIKVHAKYRLKLIEEIQTLPYRIALCQRFHDLQEDSNEHRCRELQKEIMQRLVQLLADKRPELADLLNGQFWRSLAPADFSFRLFDFLRLDGNLMQKVLELPTAEERLSLIHQFLHRN